MLSDDFTACHRRQVPEANLTAGTRVSTAAACWHHFLLRNKITLTWSCHSIGANPRLKNTITVVNHRYALLDRNDTATDWSVSQNTWQSDCNARVDTSSTCPVRCFWTPVLRSSITTSKESRLRLPYYVISAIAIVAQTGIQLQPGLVLGGHIPFL